MTSLCSLLLLHLGSMLLQPLALGLVTCLTHGGRAAEGCVNLVARLGRHRMGTMLTHQEREGHQGSNKQDDQGQREADLSSQVRGRMPPLYRLQALMAGRAVPVHPAAGGARLLREPAGPVGKCLPLVRVCLLLLMGPASMFRPRDPLLPLPLPAVIPALQRRPWVCW